MQPNKIGQEWCPLSSQNLKLGLFIGSRVTLRNDGAWNKITWYHGIVYRVYSGWWDDEMIWLTEHFAEGIIWNQTGRVILDMLVQGSFGLFKPNTVFAILITSTYSILNSAGSSTFSRTAEHGGAVELLRRVLQYLSRFSTIICSSTPLSALKLLTCSSGACSYSSSSLFCLETWSVIEILAGVSLRAIASEQILILQYTGIGGIWLEGNEQNLYCNAVIQHKWLPFAHCFAVIRSHPQETVCR